MNAHPSAFCNHLLKNIHADPNWRKLGKMKNVKILTWGVMPTGLMYSFRDLTFGVFI